MNKQEYERLEKAAEKLEKTSEKKRDRINDFHDGYVDGIYTMLKCMKAVMKDE